MRILGVLVLGLFGLCSFSPPLPAAIPAVELVADAPLLQPTSTLEFRFARPIVAREDLGVPSGKVPFQISPAVPGSFTWLSRSSGVFVPAGPWPLAGKFVVTVSKDLQTAEGNALGGELRVELSTPAFGQTGDHGFGDGESTEATPELGLAYNLPVDAKGAAPLVQFVNSNGATIRAEVRHANSQDYFPLQPEEEDWETRWDKSRNPSTDRDDDDESESDAPPVPKANRLIITPAEPLQPGGTWSLEVKPGLRSEDGKQQERKGAKIALGAVTPFEITALEAASYVNSGRSLVLTFSQSVAPDITAETASKFLRVEPPVANFRVEESFESLTLRGDFERGKDYTLHIEPTLVSSNGLALSGEHQRPFRFEAVKPRLYLPEFTGHQLRGGSRKFEVASVNLKSLKVTLRRIPAEQVPRALKAFEKYDKEEYGLKEPYQPIPLELIPGEVIHERVVELPAPALDSRTETSLDWNDLLGAGVGGAIFLTVTGEPVPEAKGQPVAAQALIQLTDLGVLWKQTVEGARVTAFSMANGRGLPKAQVTILTEDYKVLQRAQTDDTGTAILPIPKTPAWLLVTKEDDVHAMPFGPEGTELPMAAFRVPIWYRGWEAKASAEREVRGLVFTDRPLYRPGELARVKGILRVFGDAGLKPLSGAKATLHLSDPRGDDAGTTEVEIDARGAFDAEVQLPTSRHGRYGLRLTLDSDGERSESFQANFEVADFQPNAFNVDLQIPPRIAPGQPVNAILRGNYYFGSPVRDAKARWTLRYVRDLFSPEGFSEWRFGTESEGASAVVTLQGAGDLAKPEGLMIQPQLPEAKGSPFRGVLTAEVTDINQQTVTESREFRRDASTFYLGVTVPNGIVNRAGEELTYAVAAVGVDGTPLPQPVEVKAELIRVHHNTVRVQGAGKAISFRTEKREEPVAQATTKTAHVEERGGNWEASAWTSTGFKPAQAGQYRLRVTAQDAGGHTAESEFHFYVTGPDQLAWDYRNPAQVELVPDKQEYRPGETARILLKTPISGEALVTVERGRKILRTIRTRLEGNAPALEIPVTSADAPNVFVSVMLIRGLEQSTRKVKTPEYRYGLAMLQVRDPQAHLQVGIRPTREHVEPGEQVEADILVKDGADKPVADAEVTFFAVDDGVLALTGYERPMPLPIFNAAVPLGVRTGLSLYRLLPEDPAALVFANKGYLIGGGGLEGPGRKLRRDFPGTAAWMPSLRTDAQGKVRVQFRAPDALTRYRLVAVAHAAAHLFGSGESAVAIRKSLMVLPALGQFANVGDQLIARAVVRNESGADGVAELSLQLDKSAEPANGATTARVELRNGESRAVDLPLRLLRTGSAEWKWSARMALPNRELEDQVVSKLVIGSPAPILRETYLTDLSGPSTNLLEGVNPQLLEGTGVVATTVANTRLTSLRETVNQLWEYPYECAEQTTSALFPWALYTQLKPVLPDVMKTDAEVSSAIQVRLDRLFAQQLTNGGVTMWPGGNEGSTFLTAYAAIACSILQQQGIEVPQGHEKLLAFLSEGLRGLAAIRDEPRLGEQALAVYALAVSGKAEPAYHEALFARRAELSRESRALLACAIMEAKGPAKMVGQLLDPKVSAPESMSWFGDAARDRAIQLLAWSRYKPKDPEVAKLVKELLEHRRAGHFGTTQSNAWALLALAKYYAAVERNVPPVISGNIIAPAGPTPFRVTRKEPVAGLSTAFSPEAPLEVLAVRNPAKSTLFGETRFIVQPPVARQPRQDRGFAVSRAYQKLNDDGSLSAAAGLKVGDRVLVTLRVETTRPAHFVAIDDPLPAVLEAVNPSFRSRGVGGQPGEQDSRADHREIRADRVLYFCDHLPPGAFTYRYLARVRSAGTVTAGATKVEEMYRPERFGLGESIELAALPADVK